MGLDKSDFKDKLSIEDIGKMESQLEKEFCIFSLIKKFVNLLGFSKIAWYKGTELYFMRMDKKWEDSSVRVKF